MGIFDLFKKKDNLIQESSPQSTYSRPKKTVSNSIASLPPKIQDIISAASLGLMCAQNGNQRMEQESLFMMFNLVQDSCSQMLQIPNDQCNIVGSAFSLLLSYRQIRENEDLARAIADYAFYALTKAIKADPSNEILHVKRLSVLAETRDLFYYTIANAMELPDYNPLGFFASMPLMIRTNGYLFAIVKYDLSFMTKTNYDGPIGDLISAATKAMSNKSDKDGSEYIEKIMVYLTDTFKKY